MSEQFSWTCPSCTRKVPTRVEECRCGFRQADAPAPLREERFATEPEPKKGSSFTLPLIIVALMAIAGAAGVVMVPMWSGAPDKTASAPAAETSPMDERL